MRGSLVHGCGWAKWSRGPSATRQSPHCDPQFGSSLALFQPVSARPCRLIAGFDDDLEIPPRVRCVSEPSATVGRFAQLVFVKPIRPADPDLGHAALLLLLVASNWTTAFHGSGLQRRVKNHPRSGTEAYRQRLSEPRSSIGPATLCPVWPTPRGLPASAFEPRACSDAPPGPPIPRRTSLEPRPA